MTGSEMCGLCGSRSMVEVGTGMLCVICDNRPMGEAAWFQQWVAESSRGVEEKDE